MTKSEKLVVLFQPGHGAWDRLFVRTPESLLAIAAEPIRNGYNVVIIDQRINRNWKKELIERVRQKPVCVGITTLSGPSISFALEAARIVKLNDPNCIVVFGGVHVTLLPEQSLLHPDIDIVVKGEGDYIFNNLLQALETNTDLRLIENICFKENGKIVSSATARLMPNMNDLPDYPYHLIDMSKYSAMDMGNGKSVSFQTSRGCPYSCNFCGNPKLNHNTWRALSIEKIISKIGMLQTIYGYKDFLFLDDCTSYNIQHFRELILALNNLKPKINWTSTGLRADLIVKMNDDDLQLLYDSGCKAIELGVESGSERMLKYINKAETKVTIIRANTKLSRFPIKVKFNFVVGFPTETNQEIDETIEFYLKLSKDNCNAYPMIFVFTPIAGTQLFEEATKYGFKAPENMHEWANMDSTSWYNQYPNWLTTKQKKKLELISLASLFCNKNVRYKFTTFSSKLIFWMYHPIAKFRFRHRFFRFPVEVAISNLLLR